MYLTIGKDKKLKSEALLVLFNLSIRQLFSLLFNESFRMM